MSDRGHSARGPPTKPSSTGSRERHDRASLFIRRPGRPRRHSVAFVVRAEETAAEVRRIELGRHEDLAEMDLDTAGEAEPRSLVLVCGHGSRDGCCALRGTAVFRALAGHVAEDDLWLSSHQGGHRFAANVLVLPARRTAGSPGSGERRFRDAACPGGTGRARSLPGADVLRRSGASGGARGPASAGTRGDRDLRLAAVDGSVVRFRGRDGSEHAASVEEIAGPVVPASCGAEPEAQRALDARLDRLSSATPLRLEPVRAIRDPDHALAELLGRIADRDQGAEHDAHPVSGGE